MVSDASLQNYGQPLFTGMPKEARYRFIALSCLMAEGATPVANTPSEFGRFVRDEIARWTKIIRQAGIKLD